MSSYIFAIIFLINGFYETINFAVEERDDLNTLKMLPQFSVLLIEALVEDRLDPWNFGLSYFGLSYCHY
jgi:hypothetical protein